LLPAFLSAVGMIFILVAIFSDGPRRPIAQDGG
jgi:hypothetical protein